MKWVSWTNVALGLWLIAAPFALGYSGLTRATTEDVVLGIFVATLALWRAVGSETLLMPDVSWLVAVAGAWVAIAPFIVGYQAASAAVGNDVTVGIVVLCLAMWRALAQPQRYEAEVAPIETAAAARQAEAEVKAAAAWLEPTIPHYPRT